MKSLGTSASSWSITKKPVTLALVVAACLALSSPGWVFQATATSTVPSTIHTVDPSWGTGSYVSLALDSKGYAGISYYDAKNTHLKYAHWTGINWDIQTVDADASTGCIL
jgi:hypothetical protein